MNRFLNRATTETRYSKFIAITLPGQQYHHSALLLVVETWLTERRLVLLRQYEITEKRLALYLKVRALIIICM